MAAETRPVNGRALVALALPVAFQMAEGPLLRVTVALKGGLEGATASVSSLISCEMAVPRRSPPVIKPVPRVSCESGLRPPFCSDSRACRCVGIKSVNAASTGSWQDLLGGGIAA